MTTNNIRKRRIFYLCGYDPRSARHYHNLYKTEAAAWANIADKNIEVSARKKTQAHEISWSAQNLTDDVCCEYSYLVWDDIVRANWPREPLSMFLNSAKAYFRYVVDANWQALKSLPQTPVLVLFYPLIAFFLLLCFSFIIFQLSNQLLPLVIPQGELLLAKIATAGILIFIICFILFQKLKSIWLLRLYLYHDSVSRKHPATLDERLNIFAEYCSQALKNSSEYDEILLISHSYGTVIAPVLLNKILSECKAPQNFTFITLGQLSPMANMIKTDDYFHPHYIQLAHQAFNWLDISSPADGVCFSLLENPYIPLTDEHSANYISMSPRFHAVYESTKYKKIKKDKFDLHFKYLGCSDKNHPLNFFEINLGTHSIQEQLISSNS